MQVEIYPRRDNKSDDKMRCPFCQLVQPLGMGITFDDYVDYPMIWCGNCGAMAVIDNKLFYEFIDSTYDMGNILVIHHKSIKIPLLFIERAADHHMANIKSERMLSDDEVILLTNSFDYKKHDNGYDPAVIKQLGLTRRDDRDHDDPVLDRESFDEFKKQIMNQLGLTIRDYHDNETCDEIKKQIMNVSVAINCYNVEEPKHAARVDFSHDGVNVYLQIVELDGSKTIIRYWGD